MEFSIMATNEMFSTANTPPLLLAQHEKKRAKNEISHRDNYKNSNFSLNFLQKEQKGKGNRVKVQREKKEMIFLKLK